MARRKAVRGCISLARLARPRRRQRREQSALQLCSAFLALDSAHAERCGYQIQVLKDRTLWQCDGIACDLQARLLLCVCCTNSYTRDRADRFACRRLSCRTRTDAACLRTSSVSCFFSVVEIDRASRLLKHEVDIAGHTSARQLAVARR